MALRLENTGKHYVLYDSDKLVAKFTRLDFRDVLEGLDLSPQFIGHVLKMLNRLYPLPSLPVNEPQQVSDVHSLGYVMEYLTVKGYRVYSPSPFSDAELVSFVKSRGYFVEPVANFFYLKSCLNNLSEVENENKSEI
ncbi:MAG: hypothetical protein LLF28_02795 [Nitrospiraceae bacterium]|nr:hypothetical protein [Nitrospiraceae bacterium]